MPGCCSDLVAVERKIGGAVKNPDTRWGSRACSLGYSRNSGWSPFRNQGQSVHRNQIPGLASAGGGFAASGARWAGRSGR